MWMIPSLYSHMAETYFNEQHPSIKFAMEVEEDGRISFLDVGISRNPHGSLHHNVYRKPTHTARYLNQRSEHHVIGQPHPRTMRLQLKRPGQFTQGTTAHQDYPPAQRLQTQQDQHIEACPKPRPQGLLYPKSNPSTRLPFLGSTINSSASSNKQAPRFTTPPPTNFKNFSIMINQIPATQREYTRSQRDWKNTEHTAADKILRSQPLWCTPTSRTTKIDWQTAQLITHINTDASEGSSRSSSTTLFHRISVSTSAIFGDPYYGPKDLLYPKSTTHPTLRDP